MQWDGRTCILHIHSIGLLKYIALLFVPHGHAYAISTRARGAAGRRTRDQARDCSARQSVTV